MTTAKTLWWTAMFAVVSGCTAKPKGDSESELKWGHLDDAEFGYVSLAPNSTITTCGFEAATVANHIRSWAGAIGRSSNLTINGDCSSGAARTVNVFGPAQSSGRGPCANPGVAGWTDGSNVHICRDFGASIQTHILLHEVGHLWGLCDQYGDAANCDPANSGTQDPNSVMGAARGLTALTADDVNGIKALAARTDIPNKAQWDALGTGGGTGGGTTPPPAGSCECSLDGSGNWCAVFKDRQPTQWFPVDRSGDPACKQACGIGGTLADAFRQCGGTPTDPGTGTTRPDPQPDPSPAGDLQAMCTEAGAQWVTGNPDGFARCDCNRMLFREDAMRLYTKADFLASCRSYL